MYINVIWPIAKPRLTLKTILLVRCELSRLEFIDLYSWQNAKPGVALELTRLRLIELNI